MKTNTHGYAMHGLRKAAGETKGLTGYFSGHYIQISYDRSDGEILTSYHYDLGHSWHAYYHDPDIVTVCNACNPMTMQDIADAIAEEISYNAVS